MTGAQACHDLSGTARTDCRPRGRPLKTTTSRGSPGWQPLAARCLGLDECLHTSEDGGFADHQPLVHRPNERAERPRDELQGYEHRREARSREHLQGTVTCVAPGVLTSHGWINGGGWVPDGLSGAARTADQSRPFETGWWLKGGRPPQGGSPSWQCQTGRVMGLLWVRCDVCIGLQEVTEPQVRYDWTRLLGLRAPGRPTEPKQRCLEV